TMMRWWPVSAMNSRPLRSSARTFAGNRSPPGRGTDSGSSGSGERSRTPRDSASAITCRTVGSSSSAEISPACCPTTRPSASISISVGHALTAYARQIRYCLSLTTGCWTPSRSAAAAMFAVTRSAMNLPEWTPMTTSSSPNQPSSFRNCGSRCMQLIQPYVQKSSRTARPRSSRSVSARPPVLTQSSPVWNSGARTYAIGSPLAAQPSDLVREARHDLERVAHDPVVGDLEDRRLRVLVDCDDRAGRAHAREVLDRAADADRDVELRRDGLARLLDLLRVRPPARVHHGARRAQRAARADRLAQRLE